MTWQLDNAYIHYYQMDAISSILLSHSYFANPNYLGIKIWVSTVIQYSDTAKLTGSPVYNFIKFFPCMVEHTPKGMAFCHIVAVIDGKCRFISILSSFVRSYTYRALYGIKICTHILIADEQFLLLINVPIWDDAQQLEIYEVFNLAIPHRNFSTHYSIQKRYLGIMHDEASTVEISEDQFKTCQKAN